MNPIKVHRVQYEWISLACSQLKIEHHPMFIDRKTGENKSSGRNRTYKHEGGNDRERAGRLETMATSNRIRHSHTIPNGNLLRRRKAHFTSASASDLTQMQAARLLKPSSS